ncbi:hypothetical protein OHC33_003983 [Knufia fluminis]|uniref:PARP-type domain-containing protein n=1 Tax=Knufia fluminis TaxID=191047 RepID=A0AAN8FBP9_9EURO|nr:hypothetical protein OHC33_003983 [Knufia fluminis]
MSADLFAAFGNSEAANDDFKGKSTTSASHASPQKTVEDTWQPWPTQLEHEQVHRQAVIEDGNLWKEDVSGNNVLFDAEDDFGDFEDAGAEDTPATTQSSSLPSNNNATGNLLDLDDSDLGMTSVPNKPEAARVNATKGRPPTGFNVPDSGNAELSTALVEENDEWGNFEDVEGVSPAPTKHRAVQSTSNLPSSELVTGQSKPAPRVHSSTHKSRGSEPIQHITTNTDDDFDAWDDFKDGTEAVKAPIDSSKQFREQVTTIPLAGTQTVRRERPTNVPPPAVLLSLFPKVWMTLASQARQSRTAEDVGMAALRTYRVSARIISGRAQRWKRDTILAQSMRIGAAGRSGGMKLTALDRGESRKEDQEAEEAIASWTRVSHVLNPAMVKAKIQKPPMSLSTKLAMRTATGPDVLSANHVCPICGLRRNERINGIDVDVSDTFGEYWIEQWGHTDCFVWWEQYSQLLEQR